MAVTTETGSEVIAQIALAWAIKKSRSLNVSDCVEVQKDDKGKPIMTKIGGIDNYVPVLDGKGNPIPISGSNSPFSDSSIVTQSNASLSNKTFLVELCKWGLGGPKASKGLTWIDGQGRNMLALKKELKLRKIGGVKIYNDKIYDFKSNKSPYKAFSRANTGSKPDKWNPADMWYMTNKGKSRMEHGNQKNYSLPMMNQLLINLYKSKDIIPISLKAPTKSGAHFDVINTNEYFHRIVFNKTNNPTVQILNENQDMRINFTVEVVKLPKGVSSQRATNNPGLVSSSEPIKGTGKHIMLKYHVNNNLLELEYSQMGVPKIGDAKHGKIGYTSAVPIIKKTNSSGINKLRQVQQKYKGRTYTNSRGKQEQFGLNGSNWFMATGAPTKKRVDNDSMPIMTEYVRDIWESLSKITDVGDTPNLPSAKVNDAKSMWSKARAVELAFSVGGITNETLKKRVVENLYNVAGSIQRASGLNAEDMNLAAALGEQFSSSGPISSGRRIQFSAGPYIKVY